VAVEGPHGRGPARDGRGGGAARPLRGEPLLDVVDRRGRGRPAEVRRERGEVAPVGVDGSRGAVRGEQREEAVQLGIPDGH
jgi:hypothetical protein